MKNYTLVLCRREELINGELVPQLLLGMKKRGFGVGKFNGFGGKLEPGETFRVAASRELEEESGLKAPPAGLILRGMLLFFMRQSNMIMNVAVYESKDFSGEYIESDEMIPQWFNENRLPFESMWPDDKIWMPSFLKRKNFIAR